MYIYRYTHIHTHTLTLGAASTASQRPCGTSPPCTHTHTHALTLRLPHKATLSTQVHCHIGIGQSVHETIYLPRTGEEEVHKGWENGRLFYYTSKDSTGPLPPSSVHHYQGGSEGQAMSASSQHTWQHLHVIHNRHSKLSPEECVYIQRVLHHSQLGGHNIT